MPMAGMTVEQLVEIEARCLGATKGAEFREARESGTWTMDLDDGLIVYHAPSPDMTFDAHSRSDVPQLTAEVRRCWARIQQLLEATGAEEQRRRDVEARYREGLDQVQFCRERMRGLDGVIESQGRVIEQLRRELAAVYEKARQFEDEANQEFCERQLLRAECIRLRESHTRMSAFIEQAHRNADEEVPEGIADEMEACFPPDLGEGVNEVQYGSDSEETVATV